MLTDLNEQRQAGIEAEFRVRQEFVRRRQTLEAQIQDAERAFDLAYRQLQQQNAAGDLNREDFAQQPYREQDQLTQVLFAAGNEVRQLNAEQRTAVRQAGELARRQNETVFHARRFRDTRDSTGHAFRQFADSLVTTLREAQFTLDSVARLFEGLGNAIAAALLRGLIVDPIARWIRLQGGQLINWIRTQVFRLPPLPGAPARAQQMAQTTAMQTTLTAQNTEQIRIQAESLNLAAEAIRQQIEMYCQKIQTELRGVVLAIQQLTESRNSNANSNTAGLAGVLTLLYLPNTHCPLRASWV